MSLYYKTKRRKQYKQTLSFDSKLPWGESLSPSDLLHCLDLSLVFGQSSSQCSGLLGSQVKGLVFLVLKN